jgi:hypothetical protein
MSNALPSPPYPPYPFLQPVKLRGWYIKGDGVEGEHPLVIMQTGAFCSIASKRGDPMKFGPFFRNVCAAFVAEGFDVLFFDKRGHGFSEGVYETVAGDIFTALNRLESCGQNGTQALESSGDSFTGNLLSASGGSYTNKTKPVILWGLSQGAIIGEKAMAMNYSSDIIEPSFKLGVYPPEIDYANSPHGPMGYNVKGLIDIVGPSGSPLYHVSPLFIYLQGLGMAETFAEFNVNSNVYKSIDKWPAVLMVKPTQDLFTFDGAVDAYNKAKGFKDIVAIRGTHTDAIFGESTSYALKKELQFAKKIILNSPPTDNNGKTKLQIEACSAPDAKVHGVLTAADLKISRILGLIEPVILQNP